MLIIHPALTHSRLAKTLFRKKFDANTAVRIWKRPRWISIVLAALYHLNTNNAICRHFWTKKKKRERIPVYVGTTLLFLIDLNIWIWVNWCYITTMSENIPSRQESERRCLHWTSANKASISSYIPMNACGAVLFTLNKVVRPIDVCDDRTAWMLELSSLSPIC
jgi:hypothetical protein